MARNKHPEQTIEKILSTSLKLFSEKGYEKTTIQDIVDKLGMSKGAIYHHYKSKEDILYAIANSFYENNNIFKDIDDRKDLNGLEKIREVFKTQICNPDKIEMDVIAINLWKDPKLFVIDMKENLKEGGHLIAPYIEQGMQDGSMTTQDAKNASEVLLMLLNYWIFSPLTGFDPIQMKEKIHYFRFLCNSIGIPIINDEIEALAYVYVDTLIKKI